MKGSQLVHNLMNSQYKLSVHRFDVILLYIASFGISIIVTLSAIFRLNRD